jgi:GxxExxY protein
MFGAMDSENAQKRNDPRTYAVIGAAIEVHKKLGCGFSEAIYCEALAMELESRGIPFRSEVELPIVYGERKLRHSYRADFICFDAVILEIKALPKLGPREEKQLISYLRASGHRIGLLINFGGNLIECKRRVV